MDHHIDNMDIGAFLNARENLVVSAYRWSRSADLDSLTGPSSLRDATIAATAVEPGG